MLFVLIHLYFPSLEDLLILYQCLLIVLMFFVNYWMAVSQISLVLVVLANQMGVEQGCQEQTGLLHGFLTLLSLPAGESCAGCWRRTAC